MAERAKKISELTTLTNAAANDLFIIVDGVGTSSVETKSITVSSLFANVSIATTLKSTLTVSGTTTVSNNINVSGTVNAASFSGNGASVTSVDASTLEGNTVSDITTSSKVSSLFVGYAVDSTNRNVMSANGTDGYLVSSYTGNNPDVYVLCGTTVSFDLTSLSSHPFNLLDESNTEITDNLVHIGADGSINTGANAQSKTSGILYWQIPTSLGSATYHYQCDTHGGMYGNVVIKDITTI